MNWISVLIEGFEGAFSQVRTEGLSVLKDTATQHHLASREQTFILEFPDFLKINSYYL
jgi:hypothetical protein